VTKETDSPPLVITESKGRYDYLSRVVIEVDILHFIQQINLLSN